MKPILKINGTDFTEYLADDGIQSSLNDLDADGSGRNILDGLMYRTRIATKDKRTILLNRIDEDVMLLLIVTLYQKKDYADITLLDPKQNRHITRSYYFSTINEGIQRYREGHTVYDGVTFNITER